MRSIPATIGTPPPRLSHSVPRQGPLTLKGASTAPWFHFVYGGPLATSVPGADEVHVLWSIKRNILKSLHNLFTTPSAHECLTTRGTSENVPKGTEEPGKNRFWGEIYFHSHGLWKCAKR